MPKSKTLNISAILSIIIGIIILIWPDILGIAVGLYLVLIGILQLLNK